MFVQVIKGKVTDADGWLKAGERWRDEVRPGAKGFLGSTSGVTDDGTAIIIARFEDEASARANSERPEQTAWYEDAQKYFDGEPAFRESSDTSTLFEGGSDRAGFVQIMEGTVPDRAKAEALETDEMLEQLRKARPDLLGGLRVWFDGGDYIECAYFTSEEEARVGEKSGDFEAPAEEFDAAFGEMSYLDLREPQFFS